MAGNIFGKLFRIASFGESHGPALGVVIDGCPAGLPLTEEKIQAFLDRRRPGQGFGSTARREEDRVEILSGVFEGRTSGTAVAMLVRNADQRSKDYEELRDVFRPGHADYPFQEKYGLRDFRGGGRSSGRETVARVAGGAVASLILSELGVSVHAELTELAGEEFVSEEGRKRAEEKLSELQKEGDSAGGVVTLSVKGLPAGIGEPVFDKLDARLAEAMLSIGAVKALEFGAGAESARMRGSENNDSFLPSFSSKGEEDGQRKGTLRKESNHSGGVLGGMSDGSELLLRVFFKPTPSIGLPQRTVDRWGRERVIAISGRHDPTVSIRAAVVVECMAALVLLDCMMENALSRLDQLKKIYP